MILVMRDIAYNSKYKEIYQDKEGFDCDKETGERIM